MSMTTEPAQGQAAYEAGELDMVLTPSEDIQRVKADPTLGPQVVDIPLLVDHLLQLQQRHRPEDPEAVRKCSDLKACPTMNKDFRIALTQAIDKKAFIDATFAGLGDPANSFVMPGIPGYQEDLDPYPYDLDAAKAHMATALAAIGVSSAADLGKLKFGFNSGAGHEPRVAFLAEAWRTGVRSRDRADRQRLQRLPPAAHGRRVHIARDAWGADYPHANNQLGLFVCGGGNNDVQYCNPDFDALMAQAAGEPDQDKQVALYNQAQTILMDDAAFLPLRFAVSTFEVQPYVGGITATPSDSQLPGDLFYETIQITEALIAFGDQCRWAGRKAGPPDIPSRRDS